MTEILRSRSRSRPRSDISLWTVKSYVTESDGGNSNSTVFGSLPDQVSTENVLWVDFDESTYGVNSGYFRSIKTGGFIRPTTLTRELTAIVGHVDGYFPNFAGSDTYFGGRVYSSGTVRLPLAARVAPPALPDKLDEQALIIKLRAKLKDNAWNSAVFVGELGQSVSMVATRLRQLVSIASAVKTGAFRFVSKGRYSNKSLSRALKDVGISKDVFKSKSSANVWLEVNYGWIPLVMDIIQAEKTAKRLINSPSAFVSSASLRDQTRTSTEVSMSAGYGVDSQVVLVDKLTVVSRSARMKVFCAVSDPSLYAAQQLGLTNPLAVAWELAPLSFVLDWAFSFGDYLKGLDAGVGLTIGSGVIGHRREVVEVYSGGGRSNGNGGLIWYLSPNGAASRIFVERRVLDGLPLADLSAAFTFSPNVGIKRALSALALARQRVR